MRGDLYRLKAPLDARGHEQVGARLTVIDPQIRLGSFAGRLDNSEMQAVDAAIPDAATVAGTVQPLTVKTAHARLVAN